MYTTIGTYYFQIVPIQPTQQPVIQKGIISTNCCIHTVVPNDDRPRYARNV